MVSGAENSGHSSGQTRAHSQILRDALAKASEELAAIDQELTRRRRRELRAWEDEEPALQVYATAMAQTADVMKTELEKLRSDLYAAFQTAEHRGPGSSNPLGGAQSADTAAVKELGVEIERLVQHLENMDKQMAECRRSHASAQHVGDKALWETQLVALQDTKNLTVTELERLRVELVLKRREASFKEQRQSGQAKIKQLQDELASTVSKVDRVKQLLHFPAVEGFRFRSGSGGVFLGSKDLFVSEFAAAFHLLCHRARGKEGRPKATVFIKLGGEPPHMSFSARTPAASKGPSAFTGTPARSNSGPQPPPGRQGTPTHGAPAHMPGPPESAPQHARRVSAAMAPTPVDDSMVPLEAPKQGVWFDRAPFDAATGRNLDEGERSAQEPSRGTTARQAHGVGESAEAEAGDLISFDGGTGTAPQATSGAALTGAAVPTFRGGLLGDDSPQLRHPSLQSTAPTLALQSARPVDEQGASQLPAQPVQYSPHLDGLQPGYEDYGVERGTASRREAMRQKATSVAASIATRGSKSKQAAVGFLNKLSQSKRFGTPQAAESPSAQQGLRAGSQMPEGAFHADDGDVSLRSKLMHASKKGVAFVKTHGKSATVAVGHQLASQATAAVGHIQSKIREGRGSPHSSLPSSPSLAEALSVDHMATGASTALPDFSDAMDRTNSTSTRGREPLSPAERGAVDSKTNNLAEALPDAPSDVSPGTAAVAAEYVHVAAEPQAQRAPTPATSGAARSEHVDSARPASIGFVSGTPRERKGVFLRVQASDVKVVGEKGTKVPNFTVKELAVLLECTMEAAFEWTELEGWRPMHKLKLNIETLEHSISGTNIPVPKTLLKYLLNLLLPALIEARLLAVLPAEIGQYFIDTDTPGVQLGGKLHVFGPSLSSLNIDLSSDPTAPLPPGAKPKPQYSAAAIATARSSLNLSYAQCVALSDLLCSQHACILPRRIGSLTISHLCHLLAPLAGHPDLLARWKGALHTAVDALCTNRNIPAINWVAVSENVLEPAIRKPLRLRFNITCLDLSWNVSGVVAAAHDYFTRAAHAEASRMPAGSTLLAEQLAALDELHKYVVEWMHTFRRRFRCGRASLLTSLNAGSLNATLENLHYQGPMKIELPFGDYAKPDDREYWARTTVKGQSRGTGGGARAENSSGDGCHPLLKPEELHVETEGESVAVGTVEVSQLNFRVVLEDQLLQHMLGTLSGDGPMTGDSLARVLQCFGPCMQLNVGSKAVQQQVRTSDKGSVTEKKSNMVAGLVLNTGEVCNACINATQVAFSSVIPPLRIIRLLHTIFVSMQQQQRSGSIAAARLDALFYALARYFGSSSLNMRTSLQVGLTEVDSALLLQVVGSSPSQKKGDGQNSCCISLTNEFDMSTVLESIDLSQGAPVEVS